MCITAKYHKTEHNSDKTQICDISWVARSAQRKKWTFRQGIYNCTKSQQCKAQRAAARNRKGHRRGQMLRPGWVMGEGHWVPPRQLRSLESAVSSPSRVRGRARTTQWFFTVLGNGKCLSWTKSVTEHLLIDNTRPKTGHCIVRFGQKIKTGHSPKKPDSPVKNRTPGNPTYKPKQISCWPPWAFLSSELLPSIINNNN